jgi:3-hydroxybutyryl-CoA dehydratase
MKEFIKEINNVGDVYEHKFSYTQKNVNDFAKITGDENPIHLDEEYAAKTIFKTRIIHGFLGGSIFSKVFGTIFPGEGTLYLNQNMTFYKPMYANVEYVARFIVKEIITKKNRAIVDTFVVDKNNNIIISGSALIQNENIH